jgi:maleylacetoacetate isomerase/maleylpyruvate isomerase
MMQLYTYFQSSAAYRVRIALNLKGLKPEMLFVNLLKGEQRDASYEAVNPQRAVPSFIDDGHTMQQSLAIMEYLEEVYPQTPILPKDPFARAYVRSLAQVIVSDTAPLGNLKVRKFLGTEFKHSEEEVKRWIVQWIAEGLASFEKTLTRGKTMGTFCHGDTPTIADCCLMSQIYNANRWGCDMAPYPQINRIVQACEQHPAFIAAHPKAQSDAA